MKNQVYFICFLLLIGTILISCEKEKTEYEQTWNGHDFIGFKDGLFILHDKSIGYYNPDSNKVFPDIYRHQNGKGLGTGVYSLMTDPGMEDPGMITVENENIIEFIDLENFISTGSIEIDQPRYILDHGLYSLVSFGNQTIGGVAIVDLYKHLLVRTIDTPNEAGKIYMNENYYYVFGTGKDINDSIISVLFDKEYLLQTLDLLETIIIGIRPVDYVEISLNFDSRHKGLAILCMGNKTVPASVAIFDLVTRKVLETYIFDNPDFKPESMFWIEDPYEGNRILAVYANSKLYQTELTNPMNTSVLVDKNISQLYRYGQNYLAVSRDTINPVSYLYKFDIESIALLDSIPIDGKAKKIEGSVN